MPSLSVRQVTRKQEGTPLKNKAHLKVLTLRHGIGFESSMLATFLNFLTSSDCFCELDL